MSQALRPALPFLKERKKTATSESPDLPAFRALIDAAARFIAPKDTLSFLEIILDERIRQEFERLTAQPEWLRFHLHQKGDAILLRLLQANLDHLGSSSVVRDKFRVATSTLHREKDAGRVIAYRPGAQADFVFPLEQFAPDLIQKWPAAIIAAVGNGGPALHFLYVSREQLGHQSFAEALRHPAGRDVPALIERTARRLVAE